MADKRAIKVDTLDRFAEGFQKSRGISDKLSIEQMIELAKEKVGGGENKLAQFLNGTLTEITAKDLEGATKISQYAFYNDTNLNNIELPDTITRIDGYAFWNCSKANLTLPNSLTTIKEYAFQSSGITSVNLPNIISLGQNAFYDCNKLQSVVVGGNITQIPYYCFAQCDTLTDVTLHNGIKDVYTRAFEYCKSLTNIVIPNTVTNIGYGAFSNCTELENVRIGSGIQTLNSSAFDYCSNLTDIYIDAPEGSISGSPWGATNAQIHWNTPLPSEEV